jgi:hypothetical protein
MDKIESIIKFVNKLPFKERVELHNNYCRATGRVESIIIPLNAENIALYFGGAVSLYMTLCENKDFDIRAEYFYLKDGKLTTNIQDINDMLAEFVADWGDYLMPIPGLTEHLENDFLDYAYELTMDRYSYDDVKNIVGNSSDNDFLMDDWDDIVKDLFNIVGLCPDCKEVIYADNADYMYNYDTARKVYYCPNCGGEVLE